MANSIKIITVLIFLSIGCKDEPTTKINNSKFNLHSDFLEFSKKMENQDTITILADLSACMSQCHYTINIYKNNNQIYVKANSVTINLEEQRRQFEPIQYVYSSEDSLNFENLFSYLIRKGTKDRRINSNILKLIYKNEMINFYSDGLSDHLENIRYFDKIIRKLYPKAEI